MKITRIVKRLGRVINIPNTFSSIRIEDEIEAIVDEKDNLDDVDQQLFDKISELLAKDKERIKAARKQTEE